jgi:hypothetical protein
MGLEKRAMTQLLERAIKAAKLLPKEKQDGLAAIMLDEIESERRWDDAFSKSQDLLGKLGDEALAEHRAGKTKPLDFKRL